MSEAFLVAMRRCCSCWHARHDWERALSLQVAVSETVDAGVLVKVDGKKAMQRTPDSRKAMRNHEGEVQNPVGR